MNTQIENYDEGKSVFRYFAALLITMLMYFISFIELKPYQASELNFLTVWKAGMAIPFLLFIVYICKNVKMIIEEGETDYDANAEVLFPVILISAIVVLFTLIAICGSLSWINNNHTLSSFCGIIGWSGFLLSKMQPVPKY